MFEQLFDKLNDLGTHHQILFTSIVTLCLILISWGVQKILDEYIFPHKPFHGYIAIIILALGLLLFTQHVILHVF